jgi:YD repeat-containing protein
MPALIRLRVATIALAFACGCNCATAATVGYSYDASGRLSGVNYSNGTTLRYGYDASGNVLSAAATITPAVPGNATVASNPYGSLTVQGATLNGNAISNLSSNVVIQLGPTPGSAGSFAEIDFQGLDLAPAGVLTIKSGASGQTVVLKNLGNTASVIGGTLQGQSGNGAPAPTITITNPNGVNVTSSGTISSAGGLSLSALSSSSPSVGQAIVNDGTIDGGPSLSLFAGRITGGGTYKGNAIVLSTFGNVNNPINGAHFLGNSIHLSPSTAATASVTLNDYGSAPQVLNVAISGNAVVGMPSAWPSGSLLPANNAPVKPGSIRPAGTPDPTYGGGSMIVQATGNLTLGGGTTNDFVFAGGIVLKAGGVLDLNGVTVNQGWTTSGRAFQGVFLEASIIKSTLGQASIYSNNLNFINFSSPPTAHIQTFELAVAGDGTAQFVGVNSIAHANSYSILVEAAADGHCWVCLVSTTPINVQ